MCLLSSGVLLYQRYMIENSAYSSGASTRTPIIGRPTLSTLAESLRKQAVKRPNDTIQKVHLEVFWGVRISGEESKFICVVKRDFTVLQAFNIIIYQHSLLYPSIF